ncbi:MAG: hypothetical protein CMH57_11860 [Myxococcales bacterium]|nr:hypothetical protein [Myxococcales bacterium]
MVAEKILQLSDFPTKGQDATARPTERRGSARVIPFIHPRLRQAVAQLSAQARSHHAEPDLKRYQEQIARGDYQVDSSDLAELIVDSLFEES